MKLKSFGCPAWLMLALAAIPAHAQVVTTAPMVPESRLVSVGGVDMRTGEYSPDTLDLSIGPPAAGGFDFVRVPQKFKPFTSNWHYTIHKTPNPSGGHYYQIENQAIARTFFSINGTSFTDVSMSADGMSTLQRLGSGTGAYFLYTAADGTTTRFQKSASDTFTLAEEIRRPNGLTYSFTYDSSGQSALTRIRRVSSNAGYQLIFEYFASPNQHRIAKVCAINAAVVTPPSTHTCPSGARSVSYTYDGIRLATVTDAIGAVWRMTSNYVGSLTPFQESFYKPGISQPWLTNEYTLDDEWGASLSVGRQRFADGRTIAYDFEFVGKGDLPGGAVLLGLEWLVNDQHRTKVGWKIYQKDIRHTPAVAGPGTITDPLGRQTRRVYDDAFTKILSVSKPSGLSTHYTYNPNRSITQLLEKPSTGTSDPDLSVTYTYDCAQPLNCKKPASVTDARGNTIDLTYDPVHGGVLTETLPAPTPGAVRPQRRFGWSQYYAWYRNASGTLVQSATPIWLLSSISECRTQSTCAGTANETRTTFVYGTAGTANNLLLTRMTVGAGDGSLSATTTYAYDANGDKISEDGPLSGSADTTAWKYDALRRVVGVIGPDPDGAGILRHRATRNTFDAAGRLVRVERGTTLGQSDAQWAAFAPLETTETEFDALDRATKVVRKGGSTVYGVTQYSYDAFGRLECEAVRMNPNAFGNLPASACTQSAPGVHGMDRITRNVYDAADQLLQVQRGVGSPDATDALTNTYTDNGKVATLTDGQRNRTTFEYDGHDRLAKIRYPVTAPGQLTSSTTDFEQLTHDLNGNVIQRRLRDGQVINLAYDALNRLVTKDLPAPETDVTYTYDLQGRSLATIQGTAISYTWDALGRQRSEVTPLGTMAYEYDLAGRRIRTTWPDGFFVAHDYLFSNDLLAIRENDSTARPAVLATFAYDDRGNDTAIYRGNGTSSIFTADAISRLASLTHDMAGTSGDGTSSFTYNAANQLIEHSRSSGLYAWNRQVSRNVSYAINGLNQVTNAGGTGITHDARGNITGLGAKTFGYSSENRLVSGPGGAALQYDPMGRLSRISKDGQTTQFLYDGTDLVAEYDGANVLKKRYVHGPGADQPLVWYEGSGTTDRRWLHQDELGSVVAVSNASGAVLGVNTFDEFGTPAATNLGRFSFTGQMWLSEVELYHYKARAYSPEPGRFLQTDPVGYEQGPNLYTYVNNDPINNTDPTGTSLWTKLFKLGKALWKGGDMAMEFADNVQDAVTIFDPEAGFPERALAIVSIATELLPVSVSDLKDVGRVMGVVEDATKTGKKRGAAHPVTAAAARRGRQEHDARQYPEGFTKEHPLPSGKRMDAYNPEVKEVRELKPNNPRAIARGQKQVKQYCDECDQVYGGTHTGIVETYDP